MIDATSPVTKYYQLKDILVKNIQDGKWPPQSRMSSENELCEAYNVSRVTVRKAIDLLVQEGYVYTIKGKGTYVKGKYIEQPLTHFYSFREDLRSRGVSTYSTMRHFDIVPADARLAADLNIRQDDNVFCIERIFFAGEQPYAREFSYIPCAICPELHAQQVQSLGLYNSLKKYNIIPTPRQRKAEGDPAGSGNGGNAGSAAKRRRHLSDPHHLSQQCCDRKKHQLCPGRHVRLFCGTLRSLTISGKKAATNVAVFCLSYERRAER